MLFSKSIGLQILRRGARIRPCQLSREDGLMVGPSSLFRYTPPVKPGHALPKQTSPKEDTLQPVDGYHDEEEEHLYGELPCGRQLTLR